MPDHDLFDLDGAFASLERDIATISSPRGAGHAVATARRRRRTTYGAVAAVAVLAVGGVAIGQGLGGRNGSIGPSEQPLPPPTPLSAATLSTATAGWVDGWGTPTATQSTALGGFNCLATVPGDSPLNRATREGVAEYGAGTREYAEVLALDFSTDRIDAASSAMAARAASCNPAATSTTTYADGSQVTYYRIPGTNGVADVEMWTAQFGDRLGLGIIAGAQAPSPDVVGRMDDLVIGALQVDGTFAMPPSSVGPATPEGLARFAPSRLTAALGGWASGWHDGPPPTGVDHPPCGSAAWNDAGVDTTIGADGRYWIHQFSSPTAAEAGYRQIQDALGQCPGYTTGTVTAPGAPTVLVARGDDDVWGVRYDDWVVVTYLPRAATPPPDSVSGAMGSAMIGVVDDALASYRSPSG